MTGREMRTPDLTTRELPTPEQWKLVEAALAYDLGRAKLVCDGYPIRLSVGSVGALRLAIFISINDVFKGKWLSEDCEERRRFFCPCQLRLTKKQLKTEKLLARLARLDKKTQREVLKPYVYYRWSWTSFRRLKAHLVRNNKVIEFVSVNREL